MMIADLETMEIADLLTLAAATYYLTYALVKSKGAFGMFAWLREHLPLGGLTTCFVCAAFWIGAAFYLLWLTPARVVVYPFALAGLAVMVSGYLGAGQG